MPSLSSENVQNWTGKKTAAYFWLSCVYLYMNPRTFGTETRFAALRAAYDGAFRQYSLQVGSLQSLLHHAVPDCTVIEEARLRAERARSEYRESRDLLALFLLGRDVKAARGVEICIGRTPYPKVTPEAERSNLRQHLEAQQVA